MMKCEWILCPVCGSKTRNKIRKDTVLENYPLYCPKCRQERLIKVDNLKITVIKEPDAQDAEPMKLWNNSRIIGSFCFVFERTNSPNKKNDIRVGYFVIP